MNTLARGWNREGLARCLRVGTGLLLACAAATGVIAAQQAALSEESPRSAHFSDAERVAQYLDSNPGAAVALLETVLTQEQVDALERTMFPEPTDVAKKATYERINTDLKRLGLSADDVLIREIALRVDALGSGTRAGGAP
jgi:hypothetical protein